jgi:putative endonuclease
MNKYYVYIITNQNKTVLYTGVTNNLKERILQHYQPLHHQFLYREIFCLLPAFLRASQYINNAIAREKEIKGWIRQKKWQLINSFNPEGKFLNGEYLVNGRLNNQIIYASHVPSPWLFLLKKMVFIFKSNPEQEFKEEQIHHSQYYC